MLAGGGSAELRSWKAFGQWVNIIRKASPKTTIPEHAVCAARKIVAFIQGITSSEERSSVVEEGSSLVLSHLSREGDCGTSESLSERVRRLSERALQKGLESSRQALHKWLSQALKGGAGPAHRWCAKEDALSDFLVTRDSQGVFTADPQCVAEHYAQEWKREWSCDDARSCKPESQSIRASRETHVGEAVSGHMDQI